MARQRTQPPEKPGGILAAIRAAPKLAAAIASIVGLVAAILGLITWFNPDVKPKGTAPTDASLQVIDFQKHVTLGRYLRTSRQKDPGYSRAQLARDGIVATIKVVGASGVNRADLFWTVRDVASGSDLADDRYVHQLAARIRIRTTGDSGGGAFWVPAPASPGRYVARFQLDTASGTILASVPTEEFVVG